MIRIHYRLKDTRHNRDVYGRTCGPGQFSKRLKRPTYDDFYCSEEDAIEDFDSDNKEMGKVEEI